MEVNGMIFKELLKRGYSLDGKTRVWNIADSKLWYLTPKQAQGYLDLDSDSSYKKNVGQPQTEDLIKESIAEVIKKIGDAPINVVDLGCGDGSKAAMIIGEIKKLKPFLKIRYCPIDISAYMVQKALETFSKIDISGVVEFKYNISDFENLENITPLLKRGKEYKKNLILLLGNTLGNFEINELLYEIRSSMDKEDIFVVDTAINDNKQEERAESYRKNKKANDWLSHIPLQLGLSKEDVELGMRFRNMRIEAYYTIKNNKKIKFQNKTVYLNKGDQMIVVIAYKHNQDDLKTYLNLYFDEAIIKVSKDQSKVFAICVR